MTTYDIIKELCEAEGISVSALEKEMGYSNSSLAKSKTLSSERVFELSKRFGKPMEYFMTGETEKHNDELKRLEEKREILERINVCNAAIMEEYKKIAALQAELDALERKYDAIKALEALK